MPATQRLAGRKHPLREHETGGIETVTKGLPEVDNE